MREHSGLDPVRSELSPRSSGSAGWRSRLHRALSWVKEPLADLDRRRVLGLAAETAFWLFLSLLPLFAVAGLVAARFSAKNWSAVAPLLSSLPPAARQLISNELLELVAWNGGMVGLGSAAVFVWLASSGVHSIFDSLELIAGGSRPWWKKRLFAIAACVVLSCAVAILALLGPGLEGVLLWIGEWIPELRRIVELTPSGRLARFVLSTAIVLSYVCALYRVGIPPEARRRMPIIPGALVAVALELLLGFLYTFYVSKMGDGGAYVAGLAAIGVTMMGLYLFTAALLTGALLNRELGRRAALHWPWRHTGRQRRGPGSRPRRASPGGRGHSRRRV